MRIPTTLTAVLLLQFAPAWADDLGAKVAERCARCHSFEPGKPGRNGPNLVGVVNRQVGSLPGYRFSPPYVEIGQSGIRWTTKELQDYLTNNRDWLKTHTGKPDADTRMDYNVKKPEDRDAVIRYMQERP